MSLEMIINYFCPQCLKNRVIPVPGLVWNRETQAYECHRCEYSRGEGWSSYFNAKTVHYFRNGRTLCGVKARPRLLKNNPPSHRFCKKCKKIRDEEREREGSPTKEEAASPPPPQPLGRGMTLRERYDMKPEYVNGRIVMRGTIDCIMHESSKKITPSRKTSKSQVENIEAWPKQADVGYSKLWVVLDGSDPDNPMWLEIERPMIDSCRWKDIIGLVTSGRRIRVTLELLEGNK